MLLDQLIDGLDIGVAAFAICEVRGQASLVLEDAQAASMHYVLSGGGRARSRSGEIINLRPHTLVIAPPGCALIVSSQESAGTCLPAPSCQPLPGGWDKMTVGQGEARLLMACGGLHARHCRGSGLFDHLDSPVVATVAEDRSFRDPFRRLLNELSDPLPGTRVLTELLMKECLIVLLRRLCGSDECRLPWLAALQSPKLGRVVSAMLDRPEAPYSLQSLADIAGMSRSSFSDHFRESFGRTAIDFLKEVRLRRAAHLLTSTDLPVKVIAAKVGFASRSYFSRAFKAFTDLDPVHYRARMTGGGSLDLETLQRLPAAG